MLQAAGYLPDLPDHKEGDSIVAGELGLHGEVRRVPGVLSLAYMAKAGQKLIVPTGNEKEAALILAKPGHEGCGVFPVSLLSEVTEFFAGRRTLENALKQRIVFESVVERAVDFGKIRGQEAAKEAALLAAAGGHNLLLIGPPGEGKSLLGERHAGNPAAAHRWREGATDPDLLGVGRPRERWTGRDTAADAVDPSHRLQAIDRRGRVGRAAAGRDHDGSSGAGPVSEHGLDVRMYVRILSGTGLRWL